MFHFILYIFSYLCYVQYMQYSCLVLTNVDNSKNRKF
jgi:hypothetical protein